VSGLLANLFLVWLIFRYSDYIIRVMGEAGSKAFAKVAALFMAAIAIKMIRIGLTAMIAAK
jgi:multiple antibiotic resistance protein